MESRVPWIYPSSEMHNCKHIKFCPIQKIKVWLPQDTTIIPSVERENSWPITSWHVILPSPQDTANYKAPRIATRFCYHYLETNRNLSSVMQKTNHTSARVSDDTSSPARVSNDTSSPAHVSDDTSSPARVSDDIGGPIRLWHVSPIRLRHVSLTHPQTPINRSIPKAFKKGLGFRSTKALQESSLKAFKNFNPKIEEHSKQNHPNYLPRS